MKLHDIIPNDPLLEDLSRRGFLKGVGAAAGSAATGAMAAPFRHGEYKDQMTGKSQGRYSKVKADNGNATLTLRWPGSDQPRIDIDLPGKTINFGASGAAGARVKVGNGPVIETYLSKGQSGDYSWGAILDTNLVRKILTHSGELKIEVDIFRTGPQIFKFTIEQDQVTKDFSTQQKVDTERGRKQAAEKEKQDAEKAKQDAEIAQKQKEREPITKLEKRMEDNLPKSISISGIRTGIGKIYYDSYKKDLDTKFVGRMGKRGEISNLQVTSPSGQEDWDKVATDLVKTKMWPYYLTAALGDDVNHIDFEVTVSTKSSKVDITNVVRD